MDIERQDRLDNVVIRPTRREDIPIVLDIYNAAYPYRPPMTVEAYDDHVRTLAGKRYEAWVAEIDGQVAGDFDLFEARWSSRPDTFQLILEVREDFRRQGIGSKLYSAMEDKAHTIGVRRMYTGAQETMPESIAFLEHRGWTRTGRADRPSRLKVADANLDGYLGVEERLHREGILITTLEELGTEDDNLLRAIHDMEFRTEHDIPSSEPPSQDPFELWRERQLHGIGKSVATFWIAMDGNRPAGLARLRAMSDGSTGNGYTGVDPDYRGRGIARALKLKTIEWARDHNIDYIYTANDIENHRMLAINVSLGYQPLPAELELVKELPV